MSKDSIPKPCRECDYRREDRCAHYAVRLSTARRDFDCGICYGRTVSGLRDLYQQEKTSYPENHPCHPGNCDREYCDGCDR